MSGRHDNIIQTRRPSCDNAVRSIMLADVPVKPFPDENAFNICATEVISTNCFFAQLLNDETVQQLGDLTTRLHEIYEQETTPFTPKKNEICVAKFDEDQSWYRACLLSYNTNGTARVFFVDFGNKADVDTSNIRTIKENLIKYPLFALKFSIDGIEETSVEMKDMMSGLLLNQPSTVTRISVDLENKMNCQVTSHCGKDVLTILKTLKTNKMLKRNMFWKLPLLPVSNAKDFYIVVTSVNSLSDIVGWIGDVLSIKEKVEQLTVDLSQFIKKQTYIPELGEVCAGFHVEYGEWYRVHIIDVKPASGDATVRLIDYGNKLEIKFLNLAPFPNDSFLVPPYSTALKLDLPSYKCSGDILKQLKEMIELKQVYCTANDFANSNMVQTMFTMDGDNIFSLIHREDQEKYKKFKLSDLQKFVSSENTFDIVVTSLEGPSLFYGQFADVETIQKTAQLSQVIAEYVKDVPQGFNPNVGEVYTGLHVEYAEWYRILVNGISNNVASVLLIDFGEKAEMSFSDMRPLPIEASTFPVQGIACSLNGHSQLSSEAIAEFASLILMQKITVERISESGGVLQVRCFDKNGEPDLLTKLSKIKSTEEMKATTEPQGSKTYKLSDLQKFVPSENTFDIVVTSLEGPSLFYGQFADVETIQKTAQLSQVIAEHVKDAPQGFNPNVGEVYTGLHVEYTEWYRVLVNGISNNVASVLLIDFGEKAEMSFSDMRPLPIEASTFPVQGIACSLNGHSQLSSEAIASFASLVLMQKITIERISESGGVLQVRCFDKNGEPDLLTKLSKIKSTEEMKATTEPQGSKTYKLSDLQKFVPSENTFDIVVTSLEGPSLFYGQFADVETIQKTAQLSQVIAEHVKDAPQGFNPNVGEVYTGLHVEYAEWYRVLVNGISNNVASVLLIDFGEKAEMSFSDMRPLPIEASTFPVQGIACSLNGHSQLSSEAIAEFASLILMQKITVERISESGGVLQVRCFDKNGEPDLLTKLSKIKSTEEMKATTEPQGSKTYKLSDLQKFVPSENTFDIVVTSLEDPSLFYGQFADVETIQKTAQLSQVIAEHVKDAPQGFNPNVGEVYTGLHVEYAEWYRVLVNGISNNAASVLLIDFGEKAEMSFSDMRPLPIEASTFPVQGIACSLNGHSQLSSEAIAEFPSLILMQKITVERISESGGVLQVRCFDKNGEPDLLTKLSKIKSTEEMKATTEPQGSKTYKLSDLQKFVPSENTFDIVVTSLEGPSLFYGQFADVETIQKTAQLSQVIAEHVKDAPQGFNPNVGEVYTGLHVEYAEWYRVLVNGISNNVASVLLIDFGEKAEMSFSDMRPLPIEASTFPVQGIACSLNGHSQLSSEAIASFASLVLMQKITIERISESGGVLQVRCFDKNGEPDLLTKLSKIKSTEEMKATTEPQGSKTYKLSDLQKFVPSENTFDIVVTSLEGPSLFYGQFADVETIQKTAQLSQVIAEHVKDAPQGFNPNVGEVYTGLHVEYAEWYRVLVNGISNNVASVLLIDFGEKAEMSFSDMRPLPIEASTFPVQGIACSLNGHSQLSSEAIAEFASLILMQKITVERISESGGVLQVRCFDKNGEPDLLTKLSKIKSTEEMKATTEPQGSKTYKLSDLQKFVPSENTFDIVVTSLEDPSLFYGQFADVETIQKTAQLSQVIAEHVKDAPQGFNPNVGEVYTGLHVEYAEWYRVLVNGISNNAASVLLIDFGEKAEMSFSDMRPLPIEASTFPVQGIACSLNGHSQLSSEAIAEFPSLILMQKITVERISESGGVLQVRCFDKNGEPDLLTKLSKIKSTEEMKATTEPQGSKTYKLSDLQKFVPSENTFDIVVTSLEGPSLFYGQFADVETIQKTAQLSQVIAEHVKDAPQGFNPNVGEVYTGLHVEYAEWYRILVNGISNNVASVLLIDFGEKAEMSFSDMRPLPIEASTFPVQGIACSLNGHSQLSSEAIAEFASLILMQKITVERISESGGVLQVRCFDKNGEPDLLTKLSKIKSTEEMKATTEPQGSKTYKLSDLQKFVPSENTFDIVVTSLEGPSLFYGQFADVETIQKTAQLSQVIAEHVKDAPQGFNPNVGEVYTGLHVEYAEWYRVLVNGISNNVASVLLIDLGEKAEMSFSDMRPLPIEASTFPVQGIACSLNGHSQLSSEAIAEFASLILMQKITVERISESEGVLQVRCFDKSGEPDLLTKLSKIKSTEEMKATTEPQGSKTYKLSDLQKFVPSENTFDIVVTSLEGPSLFYGQFADVETIQKTAQLSQVIAEHVKDAPQGFNPNVGEVYTGLHVEYAEWYRVLVNGISNNVASVLLIDFGEKAEMSFSDMRPLPIEASTFPVQGIACSLNGHSQLSSEAIAEFASLVLMQKITVERISESGEVLEVLAFDKNGEPDLLTKLSKIKSTEEMKGTTEPQGSKTYKLSDLLKFVPSENTFDIVVTSLEGPSLFYGQLADVETIQKTAQLSQVIAEHVKDVPQGFNPNVGEVYTGLHVEYAEWYRVLVNGNSNNVASVLLIDFGEKAEMSFSDMRPLPIEASTFPVQGIACSLNGHSQLSSEAIAEFASLTLMQKITVERISESGGVLQVRCFDKSGEPDLLMKLSKNNKIEKATDHSKVEGKITVASMLPKPALIDAKEFEAIVFYISSPTDISCWIGDLVQVKTNVDDITRRLTELCSLSGVKYEPEHDEICAGFHEEFGEWYRVEVISMQYSDRVIAQLIDYGNILEIDYDHLLALPDKSFCLPPQAVTIAIKGVSDEGDCCEETITLLESKIKLQKITCTIDSFTGSYIVSKMIKHESGEDICSLFPLVHQTITATTKTYKLSDLQKFVPSENTFDIVVTSLEGPSLFYGQFADVETIQKTAQLSQVIAEHVKDAPQGFNPNVGEVYTGLHVEYAEWYRVLVNGISNNVVSVLLIDFGEKAEMSFSDMRPLPIEASTFPVQGIACSLNGHSQLSSEAIAEFASLVLMQKITVERISESGEVLEVLAFDKNGEPDLLTKLSKIKSTEEMKATTEPQGSKTYKLSDLEKFVPSENTFDIVVTSLEGPSLFYGQFADVETIHKTAQLSQVIAEHVKDAPQGFNPNVGEVYTGLHVEYAEWYRVLVNGISNNVASVLLIDFGEKAEMSFSDMRPLPIEASTFPVQGIACSLNGHSQLSSEAIAEFASLILMQKITVERISESGGVLQVRCFDKSGEPDLLMKLSKNNKIEKATDHSKVEGKITVASMLPKPALIDAKEFEAIVFYVSSPNRISCWIGDLVQVKTNVDDITRRLTELCSLSGVKYEPEHDEICAGFHEEFAEWYRVEVLSMQYSDRVIAQLIDYGNVLEIDYDHLLALPDKSFCLPPQAVTIAIKGVSDEGDCCEETITLLESKIKLQKITCTIDSFTGSYIVSKMIKHESGEDICSLFPLVHQTITATTKTYKLSDLQKFVPSENTFDIVVTSLEGPSLFYGQLADVQAIHKTAQLSQVIAEHVKDAPQGFNPNVGEVYTGLHVEYAEWYRVLVNGISNNVASVLLIDFGEKAEMSFSDMRPLPIEASTFPVQGIACSLNGHYQLSSEAIAEFASLTLMQKITVERISESGGVLQVRCFDKNGEPDLLTKLSKIKSTEEMKATTEPQGSKTYKLSDLQKFVPSESTFDIVVTSLEGPSLFYGQLADVQAIHKTAQLSQVIAEHVKDVPQGFNPNVGDVYTGLHVEYAEWYRVLVNGITNNVASVLLIDFGEKAEMSFSDMRPLPIEASTFPVQGIAFSLNGHYQLSSEAIASFASLVLMQKITIERISESGGVLQVRAFDKSGEPDLLTKLIKVTVASRLNQATIKEEKVMIEDLPKTTFNNAKELEAIVLDVNGPTDISCWIGDLTQVKADVDGTTARLTELCSLPRSNYKPAVGEVCAGFHEEYAEWYRVHVLELHCNDKVTVKLIDYGNVMQMDCKHLMSLPDDSFCISCHAVAIAIKDACNDKCDEESRALIKSKLELQKITCTIDGYTDRYLVSKMIKQDDGEDICSLFSVSSQTFEAATTAAATTAASPTTYKLSDLQRSAPVGNKFDVVVTSVEGTSSFYGQFADSEMINETAKLSHRITEHVKDVPNGFKPIVGGIYAGLHVEYGEWYRVLVKDISSATSLLSVFLLDFGENAEISLANIRLLPLEVSTYPIQAIPFKLDGCSKLTAENEIQFCKAVRFQRITVEKISEEECGVLKVRVFVDDDKKDLFTKLTTCVPSPKQFTQTPPDTAVLCTPEKKKTSRSLFSNGGEEEIDRYTGLPVIAIPDSCQVMITHVASVDCIYAQAVIPEILERDFETKVEINDYCIENNSPYTPSKNELCCGVFQDDWYRVFVKELTYTSAKVIFIDYGNEVELAFDQLRNCPSKFIRLPSLVVAFQLSVSDGQSCITDSQENVSILKGKIENEICSIQIVSRDQVDGGKMIVNMTDDSGTDVVSYLKLNETLNVPEQISNKETIASKEPVKAENSPTIDEIASISINSSTEVSTAPVTTDKEEVCHVNAVDEEKVSTVPADEKPASINIKKKNSLDIERTILSKLPSDVHPLESVAMKMNISVVSGNVENLCVAYIESPYLLYGVNENVKTKLDEMKTKLSESCNQLESREEFKLKAGALCAVQDSPLPWQRAVITEVSDTDCTVFMIDSGETTTILNDSMRALGKEFKALPAQAIPMKLFSVKPMNDEKEWSNEVREQFRSMLLGQTVRALRRYREGVVTNVKLKVQPDNVLVDKLVEARGMGASFEPVIPQNVVDGELKKEQDGGIGERKSVPFDSVTQVIDLEKAPMTEGGDSPSSSFQGIVTCVVSPRLFYARLYDEEKMKRVDEITSELKSLYGKEAVREEKEELEFTKGQLCTCLLNNHWYRAYVIDYHVRSKKYILWLIDFGMRDFFSAECIQPLPESMRAFPAQALTMQLHHLVPSKGHEKHPEATVKRFKKLTLNKVMTIDVKKMHGLIHRVAIFDGVSGLDIAENLVRNGFANYIYGYDASKNRTSQVPHENGYLSDSRSSDTEQRQAQQSARRYYEPKQCEKCISCNAPFPPDSYPQQPPLYMDERRSYHSYEEYYYMPNERSRSFERGRDRSKDRYQSQHEAQRRNEYIDERERRLQHFDYPPPSPYDRRNNTQGPPSDEILRGPQYISEREYNHYNPYYDTRSAPHDENRRDPSFQPQPTRGRHNPADARETGYFGGPRSSSRGRVRDDNRYHDHPSNSDERSYNRQQKTRQYHPENVQGRQQSENPSRRGGGHFNYEYEHNRANHPDNVDAQHANVTEGRQRQPVFRGRGRGRGRGR